MSKKVETPKSIKQRVEEVEKLLNEHKEAFQQAELVKLFLTTLFNDLLQMDPSFATTRNLSDDEIKRLYGCYKISSRVKSRKSIMGNVLKDLRISSDQTSVEQFFKLLGEENNTNDPLEKLTSCITDIIGIRIVCYTQRQKNRVFSLLRRMADPDHSDCSFASDIVETSNVSGPKLKSRLEDLGKGRFFKIVRKGSWKYFNPQPGFLDSNDLIGFTADRLGLTKSRKSKNEAIAVLLGKKKKKDTKTLSDLEKEQIDRWNYFSFSLPHEFLPKDLGDSLRTCSESIHTAYLEHASSHRTSKALDYEIRYSDEGYSSTQTVFELQVGTFINGDFKANSKTQFEIQVRTLLEDAFSEPEHSVVYKGGLSLSARTTAKTLGSELDSADDTLQALFDHRDVERTPKNDFFLIQQSSVLPVNVDDPTLRRDLRRVQWMHRDRLYHQAFVHVAKMKLHCRSYDVNAKPAGLEPLEHASLFATLLAEQCISMLSIAYASNDNSLLERCLSAYQQLSEIFSTLAEKKTDSFQEVCTLREQALAFICHFRSSLILYLQSKEEADPSTANGLMMKSHATAKTAWERAKEMGKDSLHKQLDADIFHYCAAWYCSSWARYKKIKSGTDELKEEDRRFLEEACKLDSWVGLWATNTACFNGIPVFDWENRSKRADALVDKIKSNNKKPLAELLEENDRLGHVPRNQWTSTGLSLAEDAALVSLRPHFKNFHVGHLKVLDSVILLDKKLYNRESLMKAIVERCAFLQLHGFISSKDPFVTNILSSVEQREKELFPDDVTLVQELGPGGRATDIETNQS